MSLRTGDIVEIVTDNHEVPTGTIGTIVQVAAQPGLPRSFHVEWNLRKWPYVKKSWHHDTELAKL